MLLDNPRGKTTRQDTVTIEGRFAWKIFSKNGFSIWTVQLTDGTLQTPEGEQLLRVVVKGGGIDPELPALDYRITGTWEKRRGDSSEYQIRALAVTPLLPASQAGMIAFLSSPYIRGCGPVTARKIVAQFGSQTWQILERSPERLTEIRGLGARQAERIASSYAESVSYRDMIAELAPFGIGAALAVRIAQKLPNARNILSQDPYQLCMENVGVGFLTADQIAKANGLTAQSKTRLDAGLRYCFQRAELDGNCYLTEDQLMTQALRLLDTPDQPVSESESEPEPGPGSRQTSPAAAAVSGSAPKLPADSVTAAAGQGCPGSTDLIANIRRAVLQLTAAGVLVRETPPQSPPRLYEHQVWQMEMQVARRLLRLREASPAGLPSQKTKNPADKSNGEPRPDPELAERVNQAAGQLGFVPSDEQLAAAVRFLQVPLLLLTGIPGSGKTSTLRLLLTCLGQPDEEVLLCAPTGRAARRMAEQTGHPAQTLHSALQLDPETDEMPDDPLEVKTIIVDEASMIDLSLMHRFLSRIRPGTRLLICGDPDQLPSVGAGNVLTDLLASGVLPIVRLTRLFRQAKESVIAQNAALIRAGQTELTFNESCAFVRADSYEQAADLILRLYLKAVTYTGDENEVVCLTPFRRNTATGSNALNLLLKNALNPPAEGDLSIQTADKTFYQNDRVMLLRNMKLPLFGDESRTEPVSNGDTGRIEAIYPDKDGEASARVSFNHQSFLLTAADFQYVDWAYACTIHKSQGSEYGFVILCLMNGHHVMLKRNLLYTALTRAKQNIIIVGQRQAVVQAIQTEDSRKRQTGLSEKLQAAAGASDVSPELQSAAD